MNKLERLKKSAIQFEKSGNNVMVCCPFHNESKPSLGIDFSKQKYNCFGCGAKGSGKVAISKLLGILTGEGEYEYETPEKEIDLSDLKQRLKKAVGTKENSQKIKILKNFNLNNYDYPRGKYAEYLLQRKIKENSWKKFNIRTKAQRIIVPIYDKHNRPVATLARAIEKDLKPKILKTSGSDVSKVLFGLNHLGKKRVAIIVEGEFDAIYLQQFGLPAVALGKKMPSAFQLVKTGQHFKKIFLALDGDVSLTDTIKVKQKIEQYCGVEVLQLPKGKDPNDLLEKEIFEVFKKCKPYINKRINNENHKKGGKYV